jgi:hypothetical protein
MMKTSLSPISRVSWQHISNTFATHSQHIRNTLANVLSAHKPLSLRAGGGGGRSDSSTSQTEATTFPALRGRAKIEKEKRPLPFLHCEDVPKKEKIGAQVACLPVSRPSPSLARSLSRSHGEEMFKKKTLSQV